VARRLITPRVSAQGAEEARRGHPFARHYRVRMAYPGRRKGRADAVVGHPVAGFWRSRAEKPDQGKPVDAMVCLGVQLCALRTSF